MTGDPTTDSEMFHGEPSTVVCSTCRENNARPGQRTCTGCHRDYMRELRLEQAEALARELAELAEWRRIGGELIDWLERVAPVIGSGQLDNLARSIRRML